MLTRRQFTASTLLASAGMAGGANAAQTLRFTAAAGHPVMITWIKIMHEVLIPEVNRRLKTGGGEYDIQWTEAWGGTLVKIRKEVDALRNGTVDLTIAGGAFAPSLMPLSNVGIYCPFTTADPRLSTAGFEHVLENSAAFKKEWTDNNAVTLSPFTMESYQLYTTFPVTKVSDLKGKKIAMPGPYAAWIKGTGAVALTGDLTSYYEDIKSGVADGTLTLPDGAQKIKLYEVAPYCTKIDLGSFVPGEICFSKRRYDTLPQVVKSALLEAGRSFHESYLVATENATANAYKAWTNGGGKVSTISSEARAEWVNLLPPLGLEWATQMEKQGLPGKGIIKLYMDFFRSKGVKLIREWDVK